MFANHIPNKGLISRIYRDRAKFKGDNNPILKWAKEVNRHFTREGRQMENKYMVRSSTSQGIKEIKITIIIRFHYTLAKMTRIKIEDRYTRKQINK